MMIAWNWCGRVLRAVLLALLWVYRRCVSPVLGPCCRFDPSCSAYAQTCLKKYGVLKALAKSPFLLGDSLTLADLYLAPMVAFAEGQAQFGALTDGLDGLLRWREAVWTRDSFRQTLAA